MVRHDNARRHHERQSLLSFPSIHVARRIGLGAAIAIFAAGAALAEETIEEQRRAALVMIGTSLSSLRTPYALDGRFDSLAEAVDHFIGWLQLDLDAAEKADLLAYVETIGFADRSEALNEEKALRKRFSDLGDLMERLVALDDAALTMLAIGEINRSFKAIQMYYRDPPQRATRKVLGEWMEALRVVARRADRGERDAALLALAAYRGRIETDPPSLPSQETSGGSSRY